MHVNFYDATLVGCQIGLRRTRKDAPENSCKSTADIQDAYFCAVSLSEQGRLFTKDQPRHFPFDQAGKRPAAQPYVTAKGALNRCNRWRWEERDGNTAADIRSDDPNLRSDGGDLEQCLDHVVIQTDTPVRALPTDLAGVVGAVDQIGGPA